MLFPYFSMNLRHLGLFKIPHQSNIMLFNIIQDYYMYVPYFSMHLRLLDLFVKPYQSNI